MIIQGVPITATGVAVIKVKNERESILCAIEQFHSGNESATNQRIRDTSNSVLEGKLREIVGKMTVEEIYKDREAFSQQVREVADISLATMGFELLAFTIKEITDPNGYLEALGAPRIAAVKKDAAIAEAEADRDARMKIAEATRAGEEARLQSEATVAEAEKEKNVRQSLYEKEAQTAKAEAYRQYGDAAVIQMIVEALPEMAKNIAAPIGNIDRLVVWDGGEKTDGGAMKLVNSVTKTLSATTDAVNEMVGFDIKKALGKFAKPDEAQTLEPEKPDKAQTGEL